MTSQTADALPISEKLFKKIFSTDLLKQNSSSSSSTCILQLLSLHLQAGAPSHQQFITLLYPLASVICSPHLDHRHLQLLSHLPLLRTLKFISHRPHYPLAFALAIYSPSSSRSPSNAPSTSGSSTSHSPRSSGSISSSQVPIFSSSPRDSPTNVPLPDN